MKILTIIACCSVFLILVACQPSVEKTNPPKTPSHIEKKQHVEDKDNTVPVNEVNNDTHTSKDTIRTQESGTIVDKEKENVKNVIQDIKDPLISKGKKVHDESKDSEDTQDEVDNNTQEKDKGKRIHDDSKGDSTNDEPVKKQKGKRIHDDSKEDEPVKKEKGKRIHDPNK